MSKAVQVILVAARVSVGLKGIETFEQCLLFLNLLHVSLFLIQSILDLKGVNPPRDDSTTNPSKRELLLQLHHVFLLEL